MPNEIILPVEDPENIELEMEVSAGVTIKAPVDSTLTQGGMAADAKAAGDLIRQNAAGIAELEETAAGKLPKPATDGTAGQLLQTNGDGTTAWTNQGTPTAAQVETAVEHGLLLTRGSFRQFPILHEAAQCSPPRPSSASVDCPKPQSRLSAPNSRRTCSVSGRSSTRLARRDAGTSPDRTSTSTGASRTANGR